MNIAFIGVDPGKSGGICLLVPELKYIEFVEMAAKPMFIYEWMRAQNKNYNLQVIMLEKVHAIQGTSAGSNFTFGYNTGGISWLSDAVGCGVDHVTPKTWQKYLGVTHKGKAIKKEVAKLISQMYPYAEIHGPRGGLLDGRSDALAIAHYASHKWRI